MPWIKVKTNVPQNSPATGEKISEQKWAKKSKKSKVCHNHGVLQCQDFESACSTKSSLNLKCSDGDQERECVRLTPHLAPLDIQSTIFHCSCSCLIMRAHWKSAETRIRWGCVRVWRYCQTWHALPRPMPPLAKLGTPPTSSPTLSLSQRLPSIHPLRDSCQRCVASTWGWGLLGCLGRSLFVRSQASPMWWDI